MRFLSRRIRHVTFGKSNFQGLLESSPTPTICLTSAKFVQILGSAYYRLSENEVATLSLRNVTAVS